MRTARAIAGLLRASLSGAMQYRADFWLEGFTGLLRAFGALVPLWLVWTHTNAIAGWTVDEALLVLGLFQLLSAFHAGIMEPNLGEIVEAIRNGSFDLWLLRPVDAQLLVSIRKVAPAHVWDVLAGLALLGLGLSRVGLPGPVDVVMALVLFGLGLCAMYGVWLLAICTSFHFVRVDNLRFLITSSADAGRWPIDVYTGIARFAFVAIVPVALVTSFPAEALRGVWTWQTLGISALVAVVLVGGSRVAWTRSLASYTSASS